MLSRSRRSIVDRLPSSYQLGVGALHWFYPTVEFNLEVEKPTVLAPLLAVMTRVSVTDVSATSDDVPSNSTIYIDEDIAPLIRKQTSGSKAAGGPGSDQSMAQSLLHQPSTSWFRPWAPDAARARWFANEEIRRTTNISPSDIITTDFNNGFIDFRDLTLSIPRMPFTIPLSHYMLGRPVQYVCMSRHDRQVFWCVVFTIVEDVPE